MAGLAWWSGVGLHEAWLVLGVLTTLARVYYPSVYPGHSAWSSHAVSSGDGSGHAGEETASSAVLDIILA